MTIGREESRRHVEGVVAGLMACRRGRDAAPYQVNCLKTTDKRCWKVVLTEHEGGWRRRRIHHVPVNAGYGRPVITRADMKALTEFVAETLRMQKRAASIGSEDDPPLWSLSMDKVALRLLRWSDPDYALRLKPSAGDGSVIVEGQPKCLGAHLEIHEDIVHHEFLGQMTGHRRIVLAAKKDCRIILTDTTVPETIIGDLVGRELSEVVSHPALEGLRGIRIKRAYNVPEGLTMHYTRRPEPMAEAPMDADTSWRVR